MGLLPSQFYQMHWADFISMLSGFQKGKIYYEDCLRRAVKLMLLPYSKASLTEFQIWPLPGDEEKKKQISEVRDASALATLNRHKNNNITYIMVGEGKDRKIIEVVNKPKEN